jgi:mono/diheme cytochrome c family protein
VNHWLSRHRLSLSTAVLTWMVSCAWAQSNTAPLPSAGLMPNPAQGKRLFEQHCASCHGSDLKGTHQGPPFLHPVYEPSHHGDASFQAAARYGVRAHHWKWGDMPPVGGISADDVAHITAYVRQQQRSVGIR